MKILALICAALLCSTPTFGADVSSHSGPPVLAPGDVPVITIFRGDGSKFTQEESASLFAMSKELADQCAKQIAPQFGITPNELEQTVGMSAKNANVRYAWNACISKAFANAESDGRFPKGVDVIIMGSVTSN